MISPVLVCCFFGAYLLGCINGGYYLVRLFTRQDLRTLGSGNAGATNAGRILGKTGFASVFAVDCLKGGLAVFLAGQAGVSAPWLPWVLLFAALGHIFPFQLGWKGGKGISTVTGGVLAYDPRFFLANLVLLLILLGFSQKKIFSGMLIFGGLAITAWVWSKSPTEILGFLGIGVLIIWAHRENIRPKSLEPEPGIERSC